MGIFSRVVLEMKVLPQMKPLSPLYTLLYGLKSSDSYSVLSKNTCSLVLGNCHTTGKVGIFYDFLGYITIHRGKYPSRVIAKEQEFGCGYLL